MQILIIVALLVWLFGSNTDLAVNTRGKIKDIISILFR